MFGVEPLARIIRHDARIEVKVPAKQGRKAYSYFREGGESEKKSSGMGKEAALIGGGLALAGLGAAAIAMSRKKPSEQVTETPVNVSEPEKKTNNTARNVVIGAGVAGLGAGAAAIALKKKKVETKKEQDVVSGIKLEGSENEKTPRFVNFDDLVYSTAEGRGAETDYATIGNSSLLNTSKLKAYANGGGAALPLSKMTEQEKSDLASKIKAPAQSYFVTTTHTIKGDDGNIEYVLQASAPTGREDFAGRDIRNSFIWKLPKGVVPADVPMDWAARLSDHLEKSMGRDNKKTTEDREKAYEEYKAKFRQGIPLRIAVSKNGIETGLEVREEKKAIALLPPASARVPLKQNEPMTNGIIVTPPPKSIFLERTTKVLEGFTEPRFGESEKQGRIRSKLREKADMLKNYTPDPDFLSIDQDGMELILGEHVRSLYRERSIGVSERFLNKNGFPPPYPDELACACLYTSALFDAMNKQARFGAYEPNEYFYPEETKFLWENPKHIETINRLATKCFKSLEKASDDPDYPTRESTRGAILPKSFLDQYSVGGIYREKGFLSTATEESLSKRFMSMEKLRAVKAADPQTEYVRAYYVITGGSAVDLRSISFHQGESEYTYPPNTDFRVTKLDYDKKNKKALIHMEEVLNDGK